MLPDLIDTSGSGKTVFVKLDYSSPAHPVIVRQLFEELSDRGYTIIAGDSPLVGSHISDRVRDYRPVFDKFGLRPAVLERHPVVPFAIDTRVYYVSKAVVEADMIIAVARLHNDPWCGHSGVIRTMFGILPGVQKTRLLKKLGGRSVAQLFVDVFAIAQPDFGILEVPRPQSDPMRSGWLLRSADCVGLDSCAQSLIGEDPFRNSLIRLAAEAGLGICRSSEGAEFANIPRTRKLASRGLDSMCRAVSRWEIRFLPDRLDFDPDRCKSCAECVSHCPTNALKVDHRGGMPVYREALCIGCCQCVSHCASSAINASSVKQQPIPELCGAETAIL